MRNRYRAIALALSLVLSLVAAWLFAPGGPAHGYELSWLDRMIVWRYQLMGPLPQDERIHLVGVTENDVKAISKPTAFWLGDVAAVCNALLDGGATAVGVDILFDSFVDGLQKDPAYAPATARLEAEEAEMIAAVARGQIVLAEHRDAGGKHAGSARTFAAVAESLRNTGMANVAQDYDGVLRRVPFYFLEDGSVNVLSFRLAELSTLPAPTVPPAEERLPQRTFRQEGDRILWGDQAIPTELDRSDTGGRPEGTACLRINYPAPADDWGSSFPHDDYYDLLARVRKGEPLSEFKDKIVILCWQSGGEQDIRTTPFNLLTGRDSLGAEVHASALNTLLTGRFIRPFPLAAWYGIPVVLGLALCWAAYSLRTKFGIPSGVALLFAYVFGVGLLVFSRTGWWAPVLGPATAMLGSLFIGYLMRYFALQNESRHIKQLFGSYVSPKVMRRIVQNPSKLSLEGESRRVTVLFSDINNFTPICERHTPQEIIVMLNRFFEEMTAVIERNDGYIKQFVGDQIMVIFGAPDDQPDHAARAVRTGMEMIERLKVLEAEANGAAGFYGVGIGINTGPVVAGSVGSRRRQEYAAVGDDVNLGARIESQSKKLGVGMLVSDQTRKEAQPLMPDVEWISKGVHQFKGKSAQMELWEVRPKNGG